MPNLSNSPTPASDAAAIETLREAFAVQRAAFAKDRHPSLEIRRERLGALVGMLAANRKRISEALAADFGAHPAPASDLIEVLGPMGRANHVSERLEQWMQPSAREIDPGLLGSATARVDYQPKGVIGNMVPWNFPFDLSVGPLVEMLAAGNRAIIKPSEYTPACAELLAEMIAATFDPDLVTTALGGVELAKAFAAMPWDHLLYTGNPEVGRQVMAAAAANLTPVTLELGGKCPAVLTPGSVNAQTIESIIGTKIIKNGQMCVTVDYALVPRDEVDTFVSEAQAFMKRVAPNYSRSSECTGIISPRHFERLNAMLAEARDHGAQVVTLEEDAGSEAASRCMPMALVVDPPATSKLLREEIFGPLLPIVPYDDLDEAIERINAGARPLGLYVFGTNSQVTDRVLTETHSGGAAVNACAIQSALPSMGFGGSGMSGFGRHHGIEGFREFSNHRGVVVRGEGDMIDAFYAPYTKAGALAGAMFGES